MKTEYCSFISVTFPLLHALARRQTLKRSLWLMGAKKVITKFFEYLSGLANQTLTVCGQTSASDRHQAAGQEGRSRSTLLNTTLVSPTSLPD